MRGPSPARRDAFARALILVLLGVFAFQGLVDSHDWTLKSFHDYALNHAQSVRVASQLAYPPDFTYPPPSVVLRLVFASPGLVASGLVWMALLVGAVLACLRALVVLLGESDRPDPQLLCALGLLPVVYYVQWDLRAMNSNSLFFALVLWSLVASERRRPHVAGLLLATSIALKLYSVLLLPYLSWRGRRALVWTCLGGLGVYFVLLPIGYFGFSDALAITGSWLETLSGIGGVEFALEFRAYSFSLLRVLLALGTLEGAAPGAPLVAFSPDAVQAVTGGLQLGWVTAVGAYFVWERGRVWPQSSGTLLVLDVSMLSVLMLALSPQLQPHHGVLLLAPALLMARTALDAGQPAGLKTLAAALLVGSALFVKLAPSGPVRGATVHSVLLAYAFALFMVRRSARALLNPGARGGG